MGSRPNLARCLVMLLALTSITCKPVQKGGDLSEAVTTEAPGMCAAIRGNGNYIITHFTSMARVVEHYGPFTGLAGGSSASISIFLYESMLMNPKLRECPTGECSKEEASLRLALLLKSMLGYLSVMEGTEEVTAIKGLAKLVAKLKEQKIDQQAQTDVSEAIKSIQILLSSPDILPLVNKELLSLLTEKANQQRNTQEVINIITEFGKFKADDPKVFYRPGVIDFTKASMLFGRVGSFYAGLEPVDLNAFGSFLNECAPGTLDLPWQEIARRKAPSGVCFDQFQRLVTSYSSKVKTKNSTYPNRASDVVGKAVRTLVSTSTIEGAQAVADAKANIQRFRQNEPFQHHMNFNHVRFGYWGDPDSLAKLAANEPSFDDLKTQKRISLGREKWANIMALSPAEPGLARLQFVSDKRLSAGGWSDLSPTAVLKMMGCEHVVYITRRGDETSFATDIAKNLGATAQNLDQLYNLDNPKSSYSQNLSSASAVWCTDWNSFTDLQLQEMAADAYQAPMATSDPFFTDKRARAYSKVSSKLNIRGCTFQAPKP